MRVENENPFSIFTLPSDPIHFSSDLVGIIVDFLLPHDNMTSFFLSTFCHCVISIMNPFGRAPNKYFHLIKLSFFFFFEHKIGRGGKEEFESHRNENWELLSMQHNEDLNRPSLTVSSQFVGFSFSLTLQISTHANIVYVGKLSRV